MENSCRNRESDWPGALSATAKQTVIRAGFGMYNDLQDALGYRTDQNAPFNPTYSLPNLPVSPPPHLARRRGAGYRKTGARWSTAGFANADSDLLVVPDRAGTDGEYRRESRLRRIARLPRNPRYRRE